MELPECMVGNLQTAVYEFQQLFQTSPGKQMLLTTTFPLQDHWYVFLQDVSQYITMRRCSNNYRICWIRESSSKAIAHGWHQQFLCKKSGQLYNLYCMKITERSTREYQGIHTHSHYLMKYKISWLGQPFFQL